VTRKLSVSCVFVTIQLDKDKGGFALLPVLILHVTVKTGGSLPIQTVGMCSDLHRRCE
jgi:hypothetical protein